MSHCVMAVFINTSLQRCVERTIYVIGHNTNESHFHRREIYVYSTTKCSETPKGIHLISRGTGATNVTMQHKLCYNTT